jgi:hypothetical protein
MGAMAGRMPLFMAVLVAASAIALPSPATPTVHGLVPGANEVGTRASGTARIAPAATVAAVTTDIVPGSVGRSSLFLDATYQSYLKISWGARTIYVDSTATIRNTSGGAIDRIEFNTIASRLGAIRLLPVTVDGHAATASISDQTIVVALGGILPVGGSTAVRIRYGATVRSSLTGSNWMFTRTNGVLDLYRWLPWVSKKIAFDRPNNGDPFETPTSSSVRVRINSDQRLVLATTGDRTGVSADGLSQTFKATDVRDFTVTAATDYRTAARVVAGTTIRVFYRPGGPGTAMLNAAAAAFGALRARLGTYPHPYFKVVQSAGGYGMESPGLIWVPTGVPASNLRYLTAHETAHQWFYGIVGNDQANEPFTDEAAADFAARNVLGLGRASRCATARLDLRIYDYSSTCYYEDIYIQGGNLLDTARRRIGSTAFWAALRGYLVTNRNRIVSTRTLLDAIDRATPTDMGATLFAPRFPRIY